MTSITIGFLLSETIYSYSCFISDDVTFGVCFLVKDKHGLYFVSVVK